MKKMFLLVVLLLSCTFFEYQTFEDLKINPEFKSQRLITVYVETAIKLTELTEKCQQLPWVTMEKEEGDEIDKCLLWLYLCLESGFGEGKLYIKKHKEKGRFYCAYSEEGYYSYNDIEGSETIEIMSYTSAFHIACIRYCK